MTRLAWKLSMLLAALLVAASLGACAGSPATESEMPAEDTADEAADDGAEDMAEDAADDDAADDAADEAEEAADDAGDSGLLVFAHPEDATKLDPSDVTDGESLLVTWHIYDGLTRYVRGSTEVEPALATSWETSDDGLEWTFTLREGVTFHDGTPFDADAVVWNFERWFDPEDPNHFEDWEFSYWSYMFQGYKGDTDDEGNPASFFESAEALDPQTVTITLNRPNAPLLQNLAMGNFGFSSPAAVEASGAAYGTPGGEVIAAGTGPYMVEEWVKDDHVTLVANPDYWGDAPASERIEFTVIPDGSARYLALANGEIDGMNQVNPEDIQQAEANDDVEIVLEPANNVGYLGFNQAKAPWNNLDCRLAVAHAIDKQAIVDTLYAGDAEVASQMMPPGLWGYNEGVDPHPYDLDLANTYLEGCLAEETLPEEVVFYVPPIQRFYYPKPKELGEFVQASLSALDTPIVTRIESPDWGSVWIPDVRAGKADLFLLGWGGDNGDPDNFLCQFFCGGDASFNGDAEGNPAPPDEALNTLLREAATLSDQAERDALYQDANQIISEVVPALPLVHRSPPLLFGADVDGYVPSPIQTLLTTVSKE